jgi:aminocarboxymuconate-semialdehyde decarboxylase
MTFSVDIHHHIIPDFYRAATEIGGQSVGGVLPARWTEAGALSFMDEAGIDVAITSISAPGVHLGDDPQARDLARRCNDRTAELVRNRPDRFGGFAILPLPDVDGSLDELTRALDILELDGVVLLTNAHGAYLGDPRYTPVFDELQRRSAIVLVHPTVSPDAAALAFGYPDSLLDFPVDTARAVSHMHYQGVFARTPDVRYVLSHAGGVLPYLAHRFAIVDAMGVVPDDGGVRGTAAALFRKLYWDTALAWSDPILRMLRALVGMDRVVYGSDYPYIRPDLAVRGRAELESTAELSADERTAVLHSNASTLIPRLGALAGAV